MLKSNEDKTAMIWQEEKEDKPEHVCDYFEVTRIIKKIPSTLNDEVEIRTYDGNSERFFRIDMESISDTNVVISSCNKNYLIFTQFFKPYIHNRILFQAQQAIKKELFSFENTCLGWRYLDSKKVFLYDETTLPNGKVSKCTRAVSAFKRGSEDVYDKLLEEHIYPSIPLSIAYVLSFCGVVASRLKDICDLGVILVGLSGKTSTGKTTALQLMASVWGDARENSSFLNRNNASDVGFYAQFAGMYGPCICFDDIDTNKKMNMSEFIYNICKGLGRVVAKTTGAVDNSREGYDGIAVTTTEIPLLQSAAKLQGLEVRILDLNDVGWTSSSEQSEHIKEVIYNHCGFKGIKFARFIETLSDETLKNRYDEALNEVRNLQVKKDALSKRISKKFAVILSTTRLLNELFDNKLDCDAIIQFIIALEQTQVEDRDVAKCTYEYFKSYFLNNVKAFNIKKDEVKILDSRLTIPTGTAWYKSNVQELHLYIGIDNAKSLLNQHGYTQIENYRSEWKKRNFTKCDKDRPYSSKSSVYAGRHYHFVYTNITLKNVYTGDVEDDK